MDFMGGRDPEGNPPVCRMGGGQPTGKVVFTGDGKARSTFHVYRPSRDILYYE